MISDADADLIRDTVRKRVLSQSWLSVTFGGP
jgi:hypothetical protein